MGFNNPEMRDENNQGMIRRYSHQPMVIDHFGIHAKIAENGKVTIVGKPDSSGDYDEVEVPASLVFKLASLLKATRTVKFVAFSEVKPEERLAAKAEE